MAAWTRQMGRGFLWGDALRRRPGLKAALVKLGYLLLGLAMGAGRLFSSAGPFGMAAVAAAGWGLQGLMCLLGTTAGYFVSGGIFPGVRYVAASFLIFTAGFITQGLPFRKSRWFMPLVTGLVAGVTGVLYTQDGAGGVPGSMRTFLEVVLGAGCTYFYSLVLEPETANSEAVELRRTISTAVLAACADSGKTLAIRSVRRAPGKAPAWARAGREDQLANRF